MVSCGVMWRHVVSCGVMVVLTLCHSGFLGLKMNENLIISQTTRSLSDKASIHTCSQIIASTS